VTGHVQIKLPVDERLPLDPHEVAQLAVLERRELYASLQLSGAQREAIEQAVRLVRRREYMRRGS
jgi:hypothetical protein